MYFAYARWTDLYARLLLDIERAELAGGVDQARKPTALPSSATHPATDAAHIKATASHVLKKVSRLVLSTE